MGAHNQGFLHGEKVLNVSKMTIETFNRHKNGDKEFLATHVICPHKNDAHLQLALSKETIISLIEKLIRHTPDVKSNQLIVKSYLKTVTQSNPV